MRKQKCETTEYIPEWDTGTYQTGSTQPPKSNRGLIAVLMMVIIFLGGLASVLGLTNVHLLMRLAESYQAEDHASLSVEADAGDVILRAEEEMQEPSIPQQVNLDLNLAEPLSGGLSDQQILTRNAESMVTVRCVDTDSVITELTGVIIHESGYILTNAQPLTNASRIYVHLADGRRFRAAMVGCDAFTDLAVLYIDADGLIAAEFVSSSGLTAGDFIGAISSPNTLDQGSVRQNNGSYCIGSDELGLMQTDLADVSGPMFNADGQIVGFSSPFLESYFACENQGVAVSSITIKETVEQLMQNNCVPGRPCLGVALEEVQVLYQRYWQLPSGLRVTEVKEGSMAEKEGLKVGDIITKLDDQPISDWESLYGALWELQPGDRVPVSIFRDGNTQDLMLTIQQTDP